MSTTKDANKPNQATTAQQAPTNRITATTAQAQTVPMTQGMQNTAVTAAANTQAGQAGMTAAGTTAQAAQVVIGVFDEHHQAEQAVSQLRNQGFTTNEINIISKQRRKTDEDVEYVSDDVTDGVLAGGTLGGLGGLLLGAGALAVPGVGPVLAAGPIAAALSGAVAGGLAGGLIDWGIPAEASRRYERDVAEGKILTVIKADAAKVNAAAQILRQNGAKDVESHAAR